MCDNLNQACLVHLYLDFIQTNLAPKLQTFVNEHVEWWTFKTHSTLAKYLKSLNYELNVFFRPAELINIIINIANKFFLYSNYDSDLIILNKPLYDCFLCWTITRKKLHKVCLPHVISVYSKYKHLNTEIFLIKAPTKLIYQDVSAVYWLHPLINFHITNNKQITYSWNELCSLFYNFLINSKHHVKLENNDTFIVKPESFLNKDLKLKQFSKEDIPTIMSYYTKFLGKSNNLYNVCQNLKFKNSYVFTNLIQFIENIIMFNTDLVPVFQPYLYL